MEIKLHHIALAALLGCSSPNGNWGFTSAQLYNNGWRGQSKSLDRVGSIVKDTTIRYGRGNIVRDVSSLLVHENYKRKTTQVSTTTGDNNDDKENETFHNVVLGDRIRNGSQDIRASLEAKRKRIVGIFKKGDNSNSKTNLSSQTKNKRTLNSVNYKYHLLWSSGFWKRFIVTSLVMFVTHQYISSLVNENNLSIDWRTIGRATPQYAATACHVSASVALPLLASACCLIQLLVNVLAGGCVGFNTFLGPVRPYFISLLLYLTVARYDSFSLRSHIIRWIVALSPEFVDLWNLFKQSRSVTTKSATTVVGGSNVAKTDSTVSAQASKVKKPYIASVRVSVPTMGCVACINKINSSLKSAIDPNRLVQASSKLKEIDGKGGEAFVEVLCDTKEEVDDVVQTLKNAISRAGFGGSMTVESVKLQNIKYADNQ